MLHVFFKNILLVCNLYFHFKCACINVIDLFFCGKLYTLFIDERLKHSGEYFILFILSVIFVFIPVIGNLFQLHIEVLKWTSDPILVNTQVPVWIESNMKYIYMMALLSGSSFSAINLSNSYLLYLSLFSMGLSKYHKKLFQSKRFFSIILFEAE